MNELNDFRNSLPDENFKYSLFDIKNGEMTFCFATNDVNEIIKKIGER